VIGSFKTPADNEDEIRAETVQALRQLSDAARPYGVKLALEYMGVPASSVKTFKQALAIVNEVGRDNVGILLDTWHHYAGGSETDDILKADRGQIFIVHTSDCPRRDPLTAQRPESFMPGDGVVEIGAMLENLKKVYYPSDQAGFPVAIAVAALKHKKGIGYYMDRIHTSKDTQFDTLNITLLCDSILRFLKSL
jgi:2-keto-myo-inositol isomerase